MSFKAGLVVFLLSVSVTQGQDGWGVTYTSTEICAVEGSTVEIHCSYTYPSKLKVQGVTVETLWFTQMKGNEPVDLTTDSEYAGRVQHRCVETDCTLTVTDLRESDSAEYKFMLITNQTDERFAASSGVTLAVTALQVQVTRITAGQFYTEAELKCHSSCGQASRLSYVWFKSGVRVTKVQTASYKDSFHLGDIISCALQGHERSPSPAVYAPKLPSVSVSPSAEIVEGRSVTLTCSSDANPAAKYTWYKEDEDSPKASGQIFIITDFRAEHSGNYYCEAQNTRGRHNSTLQLTVVAGAWKLAAAGTVSCVLLAILAVLAVFLWIRRKKSLTQEFHDGERRDSGPQLNMGPVYDVPSAAAQRQPAEGQDELHYSSISFPQNQDEALYSNVRAAQPLRQREEEEEEDDGVEYTAIKTQSASGASGTSRQENGEDLCALYSTVKK